MKHLSYQFETSGERLSDEEASYWKTLLFRSMKIGVELEVCEPPDRERSEVIRWLKEELKPSKSNRFLGESGVLTVSRELKGLEVKIVGRNPIFDHFTRQIRRVCRTLLEMGCVPDGACGMHFHLIAAPLLRDLPATVLANLWTLTRWYGAPLRYLMSAGSCREALTRRRFFCDHSVLCSKDAAREGILEVKRHLDGGETIKGHYSFINLEHVVFRGPERIGGLHVEYRFPDMDLVAPSIVAKGYLFVALVLRAVELSKYGALELEAGDLERRLNLLSRLSNNKGEECLSDTSRLDDKDIATLSELSHAMLKELRSTLTYFEPMVSRVLTYLATNPISSLRSAGNDWLEVEGIFDELFERRESDSRLGQKQIGRAHV